MRYFEIVFEGLTPVNEAIDIEAPAFRTWFAGSKVVKNGKPMMMFHGTGTGFKEFHPGSHFGTVRAANHRLGHRGWLHDRGRIVPVYLCIKNPLRVKEDLHSSDEATLLNAIKRGEYPDIDLSTAARSGAYAAAEQAGYDGLVYKNGVEDRGKLSWVVFHPEQVRSAISESTMRYFALPANVDNVAAARKFIFAKWVERAREMSRDEPTDLSSACKFASLFAAKVFGGQLRGNFFHQWVELPDGRTLDLNDEAEDVATMLRGEVADYTKAYAALSRKTLPTPLYTHDPRHMRSRDNRESMASVEPRVDRWVAEFLADRQSTG